MSEKDQLEKSEVKVVQLSEKAESKAYHHLSVEDLMRSDAGIFRRSKRSRERELWIEVKYPDMEW